MSTGAGYPCMRRGEGGGAPFFCAYHSFARRSAWGAGWHGGGREGSGQGLGRERGRWLTTGEPVLRCGEVTSMRLDEGGGWRENAVASV